MRHKGLIGLLAVTVAAVIAAVLVVESGQTVRVDPLAGTKVLPEVARRLGAVARIALVTGGQKTTLERKGSLWTVEEKGSYPASDEKVHKALLGLAELTFVEPKTREPDLYYRLDVGDPDKKGTKSILVTVSDTKGSLLGEVITGKRRVDELGGGRDGIYVRKPGDKQSWLARGSLDLAGDTASWLRNNLLNMPQSTIKDVAFKAADGAKLSFGRVKPGDKFALATPIPAGKKLKDDAFDDPAGALADLQLTDVRPAKTFAFPATGVSEARYESFDGLVVTFAVAKADGVAWTRITAAGTGSSAKEAADLNAKFAPWIFAIANDKAKALETTLADMVEAPKGS